ncbi:hypothetical protein HPHPP8B_0276 [Helicobacter pylori Hp P-8b]|nr:hypothetical protein HPHPP8_0275 [Helicobacter pylori Hp P-8]EJC27724.1 hypothetical protein HPHPP8B_0276 [Helicobacter pylori Hp P-8b]
MIINKNIQKHFLRLNIRDWYNQADHLLKKHSLGVRGG